MANKLWLLVLSMVLFQSCDKTFNTADELGAYINDPKNGYKLSKSINGIDIHLLYKPTDMLVSQELGDSINSKRIEDLRNKYYSNIYFSLSISRNNQELLNTAQDQDTYLQMVNKLIFQMNNSIHLISPEKDTLPIIDAIYPRMYGMSNSTNLLIVYPRDKTFLQQKYCDIIVEDIGVGTGDIKFRIDTDILKKEPVINFQY